MTTGSNNEALVAPDKMLPPCRQTNVNGPVPSATVLNSAASPWHRTRLFNVVAAVLVNTTTSAVFVALPHGPDTSTAYVPAPDEFTAPRLSAGVFAPGITIPSLRHRMLNGPVPLVAVCNSTGVPGHAVTFVNGASAGGVRTVSAAAPLFAVPQTPLTVTM